MIEIRGAQGTGKTLLAAAIAQFLRDEGVVCTVEDPIDFNIDDFRRACASVRRRNPTIHIVTTNEDAP